MRAGEAVSSTDQRSGRWLGLRWLAALTCAGMLLVLVMGAAVTNTGSAEGCGRSWPLCNGQFVPEFTVSTAIEYSHRAVTGLESVLVVALTVAMLSLWRRQPQVVLLGSLMLGTLLLQAGLGAGAVLWPQSPLMLATHFGVSLIAFASTFLSAALVFERTAGRVERESDDGRAGAARRDAGLRSFRVLSLGVTAYVMGVVYLGAYVRHAGVSLACTDWPLCNGQVVPDFSSPAAVVFAHRVAALGAVLLLGWLHYRSRVVGVARRAAGYAFGLAILQALSGALVVWSLLGLFSTLLHAGVMGLLFAALASVVRVALTRPESANAGGWARATAASRPGSWPSAGAPTSGVSGRSGVA